MKRIDHRAETPTTLASQALRKETGYIAMPSRRPHQQIAPSQASELINNCIAPLAPQGIMADMTTEEAQITEKRIFKINEKENGDKRPPPVLPI